MAGRIESREKQLPFRVSIYPELFRNLVEASAHAVSAVLQLFGILQGVQRTLSWKRLNSV